MKIYLNHTTTERTHNNAAEAMSWHRRGDKVEVLTYDDMGKMLSAVMIEGEHHREPMDENIRHCKRIAEEADAYAAGEIHRCPECGEEIHREDWPEIFKCPECGHVDNTNNWEQLSMWDYLEDCLDVEFITQGKNADDLRAVIICVAWGGPGIYLNTQTGNVELYWWGDRASWGMRQYTIDALNDWAEDYWGCL